MKVKELIKFLKDCPQEASVLSRDYCGSSHPFLGVTVRYHQKGTKVAQFDDSWHGAVDKTGIAKRDVVTIIADENEQG